MRREQEKKLLDKRRKEDHLGSDQLVRRTSGKDGGTCFTRIYLANLSAFDLNLDEECNTSFNQINQTLVGSYPGRAARSSSHRQWPHPVLARDYLQL
jgi:hypothetical protein